MESRVRASPQQLNMLVEFMETHGDLSRRSREFNNFLEQQRLWGKLTNDLNAVEGGVSKKTPKWLMAWADLKIKTIQKAHRLWNQNAIGDGPASRQTLSTFEQRVLAVIDPSEMHEQGFSETRSLDTSHSAIPSEYYPGDNGPALEVLNEWNVQSSPPGTVGVDTSLQEQPQAPANPDSPQGQPPAQPAPDDTEQQPPIPVVPDSLQDQPLAHPASAYPEEQPRSPVVSVSLEELPPTPAMPTSVQEQPQATRLQYTPLTPHSVASTRRRMFGRSRALTFDRVVNKFTALEFRRLKLEEIRVRQQNEREMRALEVDHERNLVFSSVVTAAHAWLDYCRSRNDRNN